MMPSVRRAMMTACLLLLSFPVVAQRAAQGLAPPGTGTSVAQANAGTVGVVSGGVQGTYIRIAADLAAMLDEGDRLRVLPIVGRGSVQNIADLMFLRGVDIAIVQADVLSYMERERLQPGIQQSIQYITKLYDEELHVLARSDIAGLADLAGKPVNVDGLGSGTAMTASVVFEKLGIKPQFLHDTQAAALQKLRQGQISALVYVTGKPAGLFASIPASETGPGVGMGLHFLSIPLTSGLLETYLPARLDHASYGNLVAEGAPVDTLAVGAVMAVYAWPRGTARYDKVARFVNGLYANIGRLREPPNHPKWADVNLGAQLPGWVRFGAAQDALQRGVSQAGRP